MENLWKLFISWLLLTMAGDIEPNPGPNDGNWYEVIEVNYIFQQSELKHSAITIVLIVLPLRDTAIVLILSALWDTAFTQLRMPHLWYTCFCNNII